MKAEPDGILLSEEAYALVQDIIEAEERPPLEAKGIEREIRCFAITGIYDEELGCPDLVRTEFKGLRVIADLERVRDEDREAIALSLEQLLVRIRGQAC